MTPTNSITVPKKGGGTITVPIGVFTGDFSWPAIIAETGATIAAQVQKYNAALQSSWDQKVHAYNTMMESGSYSKVPPLGDAPNSFVFIPSDGDSLPSLEQSGPAVVSTVPIDTTNNYDNAQPNKIPNTIMIGKRTGNTKWFTALNGDTFPNGQTTPPGTASADGVIGTFEKYGAPVGPGWYLLLT